MGEMVYQEEEWQNEKGGRMGGGGEEGGVSASCLEQAKGVCSVPGRES